MIHFVPSEGIEVTAEKEDATEGATSADPEVKYDALSSPDQDRRVVAAATTGFIANDPLAVVNDGNTSSANDIVASDGATRKTSSILLQGTISPKQTRYEVERS